MRDFLHQIVKNALLKDGWLITHDPFPITFGNRRVYADLGAEKLLAAEKEGQKIVVEVKSFVGLSAIRNYRKQLGNMPCIAVGYSVQNQIGSFISPSIK